MPALSLLMAVAMSTAEITIPGPKGPLAGTLLDAGAKAPVVLILPGSGPTDRDGNNPLGVTAAPYRMLAEALAAKGVSSARIDKRGMFGSKSAIPDANAVTIADYAGDAHGWAKLIAERTGNDCVWLLGHSEGGLIALDAAQDPTGLCGIILVAAPGRSLGTILRDQLKANPANAPVLDDAFAAIAALEAGRDVDVTAMHPGLKALFAPAVQPFLRDMMRRDPAAMAGSLRIPLLIVNGDKDLQITGEDAAALAAGAPNATTLKIAGMNHVLKNVEGDDRSANLATYGDPSLPVSDALVEAIAEFVRR